VDKHIASECPLVIVSCPDCKKEMQRSELVHHRSKVCDERLLDCDLCAEKQRAIRMGQHKGLECPGRLTACKLCGKECIARDLDSHKSREYPSAQVSFPAVRASFCVQYSMKKRCFHHPVGLIKNWSPHHL
jgi:hypothetical protein